MNTLGALSELLIRDELLNKNSLYFEKRTEFNKPLFCSAVSSGRRLEQLCIALDTNSFALHWTLTVSNLLRNFRCEKEI
jgi:hypothetical protein